VIDGTTSTSVDVEGTTVLKGSTTTVAVGTQGSTPTTATPASSPAALPFTGSGDALPVAGFVLVGLAAAGVAFARRRKAQSL